MAGGATLDIVRPLIREHYANKKPVDIWFKSTSDINPLMAAMDTIADSGEGFGRTLITPIIYGTGTSGGADFTKVLAKAQGATSGASGLYSRWESSPQTLEAVARWSRSAMDAVLGKGAGETFKVVTTEMDLKIELLRRLTATYAFGDSNGTLGQITAVSSTGFTVSTGVVNRFQLGADIVAATTTTGATKNSGASLLVTGVDPNTGVVTTSTDPTDTGSGRTAWAVNDYLFNYADRPATDIAANTAKVLMQGLDAWLPGASVVDSSTYNGVTRNGKWELAGLTKDCTGLEPENAFLSALTLLFKTGGTKADLLICSPDDYNAFIAQKDKSKVVQIALGRYELGFDAMMVHSLAGSVPVVPDAFCPTGTFYAGPFKNPELAPRLVYANELVNIDNKDGLDFRASASSTDYEMRLYTRGNIVLPAPGKFVRGYNLSIS